MPHSGEERKHEAQYARVTEQKFWRSFHHAFEGIMYATRTQPNMRVHLVIAALVLLASLFLRLDRYYIVGLIVVIGVVIAMELLNTAVEAIVDLLTVAHHPLAKTAKDAAAGAVLVVSVCAVVIGYLVFYQGLINGGQSVFHAVQAVPSNVAFVVLAVVTIVTLFAKAWVGRGSPLQGGAFSGHAALAFAAATMLTFFYQKPLAAVLSYFIALLVAQSRVEARIHSTGEVVAGGILGTIVALAIYLLVRPHVML